MRLIGEVENDQQAMIFSAFLLVKGIECQIDPAPGEPCEVWVKDEDQFKEALSELQDFLADPSDSKYSNSVRQAKIIARAEEKRRQNVQKRIVRTTNGQVPRNRRLTVVMIAICGLVALLTNFGDVGFGENQVRPDAAIFRLLQFNYSGPPNGAKLAILAESEEGGYDDLNVRMASIKRGEIWRLVTTIFIHLGVFHLVFNMIWLYQFGTLIEHRYGALYFALIILATAMISSLFQYGVPTEWGGSRPGYISDTRVFISGGGGMSGVIYGLFGFVWMKSLYDRRANFQIPQSTVIILIGWLFFCMIPVEMRSGIGFDSNIGNWAHGIGLIVGMAIGYFTSLKR